MMTMIGIMGVADVSYIWRGGDANGYLYGEGKGQSNIRGGVYVVIGNPMWGEDWRSLEK